MKYMTADLLARCRSEDDAVAEAAAEQWDLACEAYNEHVERISSDLPSGARKLLRKFSLHDAKVLTAAVDESPHFSIFLETEAPADPKDRYLELRYRLAGGLKNGLRVTMHKALESDGRPLRRWLYDEFDLFSPETAVAYVHSILFSGGCELQLTFSSLAVRRLRFLVPMRRVADDPGAELESLAELLVHTG